jgi:hypothetical protein
MLQDWQWHSYKRGAKMVHICPGESLIGLRGRPFHIECQQPLKELEEVRGLLGLPIERDLHFEPKTLKELQEIHERERRDE